MHRKVQNVRIRPRVEAEEGIKGGDKRIIAIPNSKSPSHSLCSSFSRTRLLKGEASAETAATITNAAEKAKKAECDIAERVDEGHTILLAGSPGRCLLPDGH